MKWKTVSGVVVALGAVLLAGRLLLGPGGSGPEGVLRRVSEQRGRPGFDERLALRELGYALDDPEVHEEPEVVVGLLLLRSEILSQLGAIAEARADVERLLAEHRPDDPRLELVAARLQADGGQTREAWLRIDRLVAKRPEFGPAYRLRGRLETTLGEGRLAEATALADVALVQQDAVRARAILTEMTARSPDDRERVRLAHELRELFLPRHSGPLEEALNLADNASFLFSSARGSYARAFEYSVDPESARDFLDLLVRAGRSDLAIDFGFAARVLPEIRDDLETTSRLMDAMRELGFVQGAADLASEWDWKAEGGTYEFAEKCCVALFDAGSARGMGNAINTMRKLGHERERQVANFYIGILNAQQGKPEQTIDWLTRYVKSPDKFEPFPGAKALAYLTLADAYGQQGDDKNEKENLLGALLPPLEGGALTSIEDVRLDDPYLEFVDGEAYLRYAELARASRNVGYQRPEEWWTQGMARLPERTTELITTWHQLGEQSLTANGQDFDRLYRRLRELGRTEPTVLVGPYTRYRVAREHLQQGFYQGAVSVARDLLLEYPNLLPVLDVLLEAELAQGASKRAADVLLDRLALVGMDPKSARFLDELGSDPFTPEQDLEAVLVEPVHYGRQRVAAHLLAAGDVERALRALEPFDDVADPARIRLLRAKARIAAGAHAAAIPELEALLEVPATADVALQTLVETRIAADQREGLEALVDTLLASETAEKWAFLGAADALLDGRELDLADRVLEHLDSAVETRGGDVLSRLALRRALGGDREGALEALERAAAFKGDGAYELARLLFAIQDHDWTALPELVLELRASEFEPEPWQDALLALLEERLEAAELQVEAGLFENPRSPEWAIVYAGSRLLSDLGLQLPPYFGPSAAGEATLVLRGSADVSHDPREFLGLLLAAEIEGWDAWASPRVDAFTENGGATLWPTWLAARGLLELGRPDAARERYEQLATRHKRFGPAWDVLRKFALEDNGGDPYHPAVLDVEVRKLRTIGPASYGQGIDIQIVKAAETAMAGDPVAAADKLARVIEKAEAGDKGIAYVARLLAQAGEYNASVKYFVRATDPLKKATDHAIVAEYVGVLERGSAPNVARRVAIAPATRTLALQKLLQLFPHDPLVVLERLRSDLDADSLNPDLSVGRARTALDSLRKDTRYRPLDELRPGSAKAWAEFLLGFAPDVAEELVHQDLLSRPGDIDLWILLARAYELEGRTEDAIHVARVATDLSGDPEAHYLAARLLSRVGGTDDEIEGHLYAADRANRRGASPLSSLVRARVALRSTKKRPAQVISTLEAMWSLRDAISGDLDVLQLGLAYQAALFRRGLADDLETVLELNEELLGFAAVDPYLHDLLLALQGIAGQAQLKLAEAQKGTRGQ